MKQQEAKKELKKKGGGGKAGGKVTPFTGTDFSDQQTEKQQQLDTIMNSS